MIKRLSVVVAVALVLSGCATNPQSLGISANAWQKMSADKQQQLLDNYNKIQSNQVLPRQEAVGANQAMVEMTIQGGSVYFPPFIERSSYREQTLTVVKGTCNTVPLESIDAGKSIDFSVCYYDKTLYLDPSRYDLEKQPGSAQLVYSPIWKRGFAYHGVSTFGYARLKDATIHIKQFSIQ